MIRPLKKAVARLLPWLLAMPLLATWATAEQKPASQSEQDTLPTALIAHLADTDSLDGEFEQVRHVAVLAVPLHSSGTFRYRRADGIVWRTTEPLASEVRITPEDGVVAVDEAGNPRPIPATEVVAGIFLGIFSGNLDQLAAYFTVEPDKLDPPTTLDPSTTLDPAEERPVRKQKIHGDGWALRLTPRLPALARQIDSILVAGDEHVERVHIHETNGDHSELTLRVTRDSGSDQ